MATSAIPGPNNFMLMRFGMRRGRGIALAAGFGTTLSCIVWCALAALGLAAVLGAAPWLYKALRIGGGLWQSRALWAAATEPRVPDAMPNAAMAVSLPRMRWVARRVGTGASALADALARPAHRVEDDRGNLLRVR